jgi:transcriptional regulator with PAS, ATPase and Fis domain
MIEVDDPDRSSRGEQDEQTATAAPSFRGNEGDRLLVFWPSGSRSFVLPTSGDVAIGRAEDCLVSIPEPSLSRRHVVIHAQPPRTLEDLGSSNGTVVDGRRIEPRARVPFVRTGTLVEIGDATLVLEAARESAGAHDHHRPETADAAEPERARRERLIARVAESAIAVLIVGETGAGKEVLAERIHAASARRTAAMVRLNCAALPETLMEAELFGYEKGAFTGASASKPGLIEAADGGTLFLDEVAELGLGAQVKLLRALERGEVTRLGATKERKLDLRVISATHRDLRSLIARGTFREDLYYRLNGITIAVPPLRERTGEIIGLARAFVESASAKARRAPVAITPEAIAALRAHSWRGNIRELRNVMERALVMCEDGAIGPEHLILEEPALRDDHEVSAQVQRRLADKERAELVAALEKCDLNQTHAAKLLGVSRRTLINRMVKHGLPRPRDRDADDD